MASQPPHCGPPPAAPGRRARRLLLAAVALALPAAAAGAGGGAVADTRFSLDRGFYEAPIRVAISSATANATIRYTLDGTVPSEDHGQRYSGPVAIDRTTVLRARAFAAGLEPTNADTQTYIFAAWSFRQPAHPSGFPASWGELRADYEMDPEVIDDPRYAPDLDQGLRDIPSVSLVFAPPDLFGPDGIYDKGGSGRNQSWERPVSVELIRPDGGKGFQIDAAIRPHSHVRVKRSFKLLFKSEYGPGKLHYPFFSGAPVEADSATRVFDRLILRAGQNRTWSTEKNPDSSCYTRDGWVRSSEIAARGIGSHGLFVHLWINGLYWGLYEAVERPDAWFAAEYLGGEKESWYARNHGGTISGDSARYRELLGRARSGSLGPAEPAPSAPALDREQFCDYLAVNWIAGTGDWPQNNWYAAMRTQPPGPVLYFSWDGEQCLDPRSGGRKNYSSDGPWVPPAFRPGSNSNADIAALWRALREDPEFRLQFADRVSRLTSPGGALSERAARERWWRLNRAIERAVVLESARWGDSLEAQGLPLRRRDEDWWPEVERVSEESLADLRERAFEALRSRGYWPELDPPVIDALDDPGPVVRPGSRVRLQTKERGTIWYTLDGSDPRASGGSGPSPAASPYREPIPIERSADVRARVAADSGEVWSPLSVASFAVGQDFSGLIVSELMYHPSPEGETDGDHYEFLELADTGRFPIELAGARFARGIRFEFPTGARLEPGETLVLVSDPERFSERYPEASWAGRYRGRLANEGETIELVDAAGRSILALTWDDRAPWPELSDGYGRSLVRALGPAAVDADAPGAWRSGAAPGGTPGVLEPLASSAPSVLSPPADRSVAPGESALFEVAAWGSPAPSYQWQRDGVDIPGARSWRYRTPPVDRTDDGTLLRCRLRGASGTEVTTTPARLTVRDPPAHLELLAEGAPWSYHVPDRAAPWVSSGEWTLAEFDDSAWARGASPIGRGTQGVATALADGSPAGRGLLARARVKLPDRGRLEALVLRLDADDGAVAWVDGTEVLRVDAPPGELGAEPFAPVGREPGEWIERPIPAGALAGGDGELTLAVRILSTSREDRDLYFSLELTAELAPEPEPEPGALFVRGDSDADGEIGITDAIHILLVLFQGLPADRCPDARDIDDDGAVNITDPIRLLRWLFLAGPPPAPPFEAPGVDPTADRLECDRAA